MKLQYNRPKRFELLVVFLVLYSLFLAPLARATELIITDNGGESGNEVNIQQESQTTVTQTNESEIGNSVITESNTGGNSVSENTGGTSQIVTGDSETAVVIENTANTSTATTGCCTGNSGSTALISGNGSGSSNQVDITDNNLTSVTVTQNATIRNNISGYASTGNNSANENTSGDVTITTGSIKVLSKTINGPVNTSGVNISQALPFFNAKIASNGAGSINLVSSDLYSAPYASVNNYADINNFLYWDLETGGNEADANTNADVSITTGDIDLKIFIENFVNLSDIKIDCCRPFDPGDNPDDGDGGNNNPGGNDNGQPSSGGTSGGGGGSSSSSIPAGSEVGAGGPGVLGLSDTSSGYTQSLIYLIGLIFITLGTKLVGESLTSWKLAKSRTLR